MTDDPENIDIQDEAVLEVEFADNLALLRISHDHLQ